MRGWSVVVVVLLAGCFGPPEVPADAVTASVPSLAGLELSAWTEAHGERLRLHGLLHNTGDDSYLVFFACGHPWNSTLLGPHGSPVPFPQREEDSPCAVLRDVLRPGGHVEYQYSWEFQAHDPDADRHVPVEPGNYTWVLQASLRDRPEVLETRIPVQVG